VGIAASDGHTSSATGADVRVIMPGEPLAVGGLTSGFDAANGVWVASSSVASSQISPRAEVDAVANMMTVRIGVQHDFSPVDVIAPLDRSATLRGTPVGTWRVARDVAPTDRVDLAGPGAIAHLVLRCR
jgi:hypothetical protein